MTNPPPFLKVLDELRELHLSKSHDYGSDHDPFANMRGATQWGVEDWVGTMIRAEDKMFRLKRYVDVGVLSNEGVEDSLLDLASYAIIALCLWRER